MHEQESEPAVGRILVFSVEGQGAERKVNLVAEEETRGAVYVLNGFNGKLLAGINSKVRFILRCVFVVCGVLDLGKLRCTSRCSQSL